MNIITGRKGYPHVTSQQQRDINASLLGSGDYVLSVGKKLRAQQVDSNKVRIFDGLLSMGGCIASIEANEYEDVNIENGSIGKIRADLICAHYQRSTDESGKLIENVSLEVLKGEEPSVYIPEPIEGITFVPKLPQVNNSLSIRDGAENYYFPLYKVIIEGLNITSIDAMFTIVNEDSDWQEVTLSSDFIHYSDEQKLEYRKIGKTVEISGAVKSVNTLIMEDLTNNYNIGFVPIELAPKREKQFICHGSGLALWLLRIDESGNLNLSRYRDEKGLHDITTSLWLATEASYFIG